MAQIKNRLYRSAGDGTDQEQTVQKMQGIAQITNRLYRKCKGWHRSRQDCIESVRDGTDQEQTEQKVVEIAQIKNRLYRKCHGWPDQEQTAQKEQSDLACLFSQI